MDQWNELTNDPFERVYTDRSCTGTFQDLTELVKLASDGNKRTVLDRTFALDQVNEALHDLKNGKIIGRAIINPNQ